LELGWSVTIDQWIEIGQVCNDFPHKRRESLFDYTIKALSHEILHLVLSQTQGFEISWRFDWLYGHAGFGKRQFKTWEFPL
jgi:hypothetical protein